MADLLCKQLIISRAGIFRGVGCGRWGARTIFTARPRCRNNDSMTWRKYYKDLIGIAEIRNANDKVNQVSNALKILQFLLLYLSNFTVIDVMYLRCLYY